MSEPSLEAMDFLNEIMERYPEAISFGPGAPFMGFYEQLEIGQYIKSYSRYLVDTYNLNSTQIAKRLYQYGASQGIINDLLAIPLRQEEQIFVEPDDIIVTVGCQEALILVLKTLFNAGCGALAVVNPSYVGIAGAANLLDIKMVPVEEKDEALEIEGLEQICKQRKGTNSEIKAFYVSPDYSNPGGSYLNLSTRQRLLELAESYDFFIIEDSAYRFTVAPNTELPSLKAMDKKARVIQVNTCAKMFLPGTRIGFAIADQRVIAKDNSSMSLASKMATVKSMLTVNTSPICQAIIGGMLIENNFSFRVVSREKNDFYRSNLEFMLSMLEKYMGEESFSNAGVTWNSPTGGFFVRVKLPCELSEQDLIDCAEEYSVLWTPMYLFDLNSGRKSEIRLSCSYLSKQEMEQGIKRLAQYIQSRVKKTGSLNLDNKCNVRG